MNPLDEVDRLVAVLPQPQPLFELVEHVPAAVVPEPYQSLLVHDHHMTLAMEQFHQHSVQVRVLDRTLLDDGYHRSSLLTVPGGSSAHRTAGRDSVAFPGERVVQFGAIRFNFEFVTEPVRQAIVSEGIPLGKVLIDHNVLRHIDLGAVLKITLGPGLAQWFDCAVGKTTYGRLATIFCDRRPAVDLLEISAPLFMTDPGDEQ